MEHAISSDLARTTSFASGNACANLCVGGAQFRLRVVYETSLSQVGFKRKNSPPLVKCDGNMIHFLQTVIMIDVAIKIRILGFHSIGDPYFQSMGYCFFLFAHLEVID